MTPTVSTMFSFSSKSSLTKTLVSIWSIVIIFISVLIVPSHQAQNTPPLIELSLALTSGNILKVQENLSLTSMLALLTVKDPDEGPAGIVTCRSESPYVAMDEMNNNLYRIQLKKHLDREKIDEVDLIFLCTDQGSPPLSTQANFSVQITDVNDNDPKFTQDVYHFTMQENNEPMNEIGAVRAVDLDLDENGKIRYSLEDENKDFPQDFKIDEETGVITCTSVFDREAVDSVVLYAYAMDHGYEPRRGSAEIVIDIRDVNDNTPVILSKNFSIDEGLEAMSVVGTLQATDADAGQFAALDFKLVTGEDGSFIPPFIIDGGGVIYAAVPFDRERMDRYFIQVSAADNGVPPLSTTANITVRVLDVNDNRPKILSPNDDFDFDSPTNNSNSVEIDWDSPKDDRIVWKVIASDSDTGDNGRIFYSIESINSQSVDGDSLFQIDKDKGIVSLKRYVRSDDDPVQVLSFLVYDGGQPSLNATASLNVTLDVDFEKLTPPPPTDPSMSQRDGPGGSANKVTIGLGAQCLYLYGFCLIYIWFINFP